MSVAIKIYWETVKGSSERGNHVSKKECNNGDNNQNQKIYASMARISDNDECPSRDFSDSLQFTKHILDLGATCHMTPQVSDFPQVL